MSVCYDKRRKKYYISYYVKTIDGVRSKFVISNKEWTKNRGKRYIQSIEREEIIKDQRRRKILFYKGDTIIFQDLFNMYKSEVHLQTAEQTAYAKIIGLEKYLLPLIPQNKDVNLIFTIAIIEKFKANLISRNLTAKRTNDVFRYLKELLVFTSDREYISYELCRRLCNLLKSISTDKEVKEKLKFWTIEEWERFYNSFDKDDRWSILFETKYMAALRIGELIGLQWKDLDLNKKTLYIRQSVTNSGNVRKTKNESSNATVTIPDKLVNKLMKFKEDMLADEDDYIFFADGRVSKTTIRRIFNKHIEISNVPAITPHGLRHSCASRMINMGISPLIVSKHLRHSSVKETLDTYAHIFPNETYEIIEKVFY